jgi:hypothetical protein
LSSDLTEIGYTLDFLRDETEKAEVRDRVNTHQRILIEALSSRLASKAGQHARPFSLVLVLNNSQGKLHPLEIGRPAIESGMTQRAYAGRIGIQTTRSPAFATPEPLFFPKCLLITDLEPSLMSRGRLLDRVTLALGLRGSVGQRGRKRENGQNRHQQLGWMHD